MMIAVTPKKSAMSTSAQVFSTGLYNNGSVPNKDALFAEVVAWESARFIDELTHAIAPHTRLADMLEAHLDLTAIDNLIKEAT